MMNKHTLIPAFVLFSCLCSSCGPKGPVAPLSGIAEGHEWVDLGLPSGTKWASCNVGANNPKEQGDHFAWGEVTVKPREQYDVKHNKYMIDNNGFYTITKYVTNGRGIRDGKWVLEAMDDAATQNWGASWRMPTDKECAELVYACTWNVITVDGERVMEATGPNGQRILFPKGGSIATGFAVWGNGLKNDGQYWTASLSGDTAFSLQMQACVLRLDFTTKTGLVKSKERVSGCMVRPVLAAGQ